MSKPLFTWAGGKNKMLKHYKPILPAPASSLFPEKTINSYVEPFFGGGAMFIYIMTNYKPESAYINDINPEIVSIYECIKHNYKEFLDRVIELEEQYLPLSFKKDTRNEDRRKFYNDLRLSYWDKKQYDKWSKPYEAATLYFLMKTGFNGIFQTNKGNGRYGTPCGLLNQKDKVFDRTIVKWWHDILQNVNITCGDWKENTPNIKNAFYFFDPPYRDSFADYGNSFGDDKLIDLINFADGKEKVFVCNRDSADGWFEEHKKSLQIQKFDITYTAGRRKKTDNGFEAKKAQEVLLWHMN